jgi:hypothetical protein
MSKYPINPKLPPRFYITPNDERSQAEILEWWNKPYIVTLDADDEEAFTRQHQARLRAEFPDLADPNVEALVAKHRADWLAAWPSGTSHTVDCLDGGAWDRPSVWGVFGTLEEALKCCEIGPPWRQQA